MAAVTDIMQDVLKLPRTERSFLAKKLLESLDSDESFSAEEMGDFQSRSREIRDGSVQPISLAELQREVSGRMSP
ncbi:addiction module protein [Akkermansiaceae bacterium]|nr:addiction module protein [Akkermansiaceae bacterium]